MAVNKKQLDPEIELHIIKMGQSISDNIHDQLVKDLPNIMAPIMSDCMDDYFKSLSDMLAADVTSYEGRSEVRANMHYIKEQRESSKHNKRSFWQAIFAAPAKIVIGLALVFASYVAGGKQ